MKISELREKRRRRKLIERLTAAVIILAAVAALVSVVLFFRIKSSVKPGTVTGGGEAVTEDGVMNSADAGGNAEDAAAADADDAQPAGDAPIPEEPDAGDTTGVTDLLATGEQGSQAEAPPATETPAPPSTGWHSDAKGRFYVLDNGERATGFFTDEDGTTWYFNDAGYPHKGWLNLDSGTYWFDSSGEMALGITLIDGDRYYFGYDGIMLTGWQEGEGDDVYYFGPDGKAFTGEHTIDDKIYFFNEDGVMDPDKTRNATVPADKLVCLTFDDGPGIYTGQILDLLEKYNVKATFFMIGEQVNDFASSVKREHDMGMEQGNHSWDHTTLTHLSGEGIDAQVLDTQDVLEEVTGSRPQVFRPPGGGYNEDVADRTDGMPIILWDVDTLDWKTKDADNTYNVVMDEVRDGSIILMHEIYQASYEAAARIIPALLEEGYQFVTVSEMAEAKGIDLEAGHVYTNF